MEQTITLKNIETKYSERTKKNYWMLDTSIGKMSIFDKKMADTLFTMVGQNILVDIQDNGQYKNIKTFLGLSNELPAQKKTENAVQPLTRTEQIQQKRFDSASFSISYAVRLAEAKVIETKDIPLKAKELLSLYEELLDSKFY